MAGLLSRCDLSYPGSERVPQTRLALAGQAFALRFAAQYFFMRADCALRAALDIPLRARRGITVVLPITPGFLGGLPRRFTGPWRASIALLSLSRSAISNATM
jgi:hypothetical protein